MLKSLALIQNELREPRRSSNPSRGGISLRTRLPYAVHEFLTNERKNMDREWFAGPEGQRELSKEKYRGKFIFIANQSVAGYGDMPTIAAEEAMRNTGIDSREMIGWFRGDLEF